MGIYFMERVGSVLAILMALFFIISPSLALTITLNYPPNNAQTLDTTPTFNFTPTGSSSSYNCTLYIDGTNYGEATNIPNNTAAEITPTTALSTGYYNWNITCEGVGTTETGTSETRVIGIGENVSMCGAVLIDKGATYYLSQNISGCSNGLIFNNDNITLDGRGYYIQDCDKGILPKSNDNLLIKNVNIALSSSAYGVYIDVPANNLKIRDVDITAGYGIYSSSSEQMNNITIENVTITGYGSNYGLRLYKMNNVTVNNANTDNFYCGIVISDYCNDIHIKNSYVKSSATNVVCESDLCYHNKNIIVDNVTVEGGNWGINIQGGDSANPVKNITIMNCKIYNTSYAGIVLRHQENVTVKNNILKGNAHSIRFVGTLKGDIYILNNYMNDTENIYWSDPDCSNARFILNTTKQTGTNIISGGFLAGNFWGKQDNTGFSQTCSDSNIDGICDNSFVINSSCNIIDYMPLSTKYDPTPPEITFLTESRAYSPGIISIKLTAQDNVIGCSLNISGTTYEMNKEGNTYWLNYTLAGPVWVYANCWDSADWRTNLSTKSLYLGVLTGGRGAGGYTPSPTSLTYYSLSITVSSPSPVTLFIYDTEGNLVEKLEYVTGYAYISLPEGKYLIKAISAEGKEQTYELALDRAKSIAVTFHQAFPYTESFAVAIILLGLLYAILKKKGFQKQV